MRVVFGYTFDLELVHVIDSTHHVECVNFHSVVDEDMYGASTDPMLRTLFGAW